MKKICQSILLGAVACAVAAFMATPLQAQGIDCAAVGERVATAVKANPDQVLTVVEDALVAYEDCACEVVSAAIKNSNGSADTVKQIVLVAVQNAQTQAPAIAECAVAAAPQHAESVRVAFAEAFNGKEAPAVKAAVAEAEATETKAAETKASPEAATTERASVASASERAAAQEWTDSEVTTDTLGGKEVVYGDPGYSTDDYSSKAPVYDQPALASSDSGYFGAAPLTLGNAFLIPPVSASPIIQDKEVVIKEVVRTKTVRRTVTRPVTQVQTRFVPRTVIRRVPVSPTAP